MAIPNSVAEAVALLGVAPGADADAVRKRYRELAKQLHPDRNPDDPLADQRMAELNRARDLLADGVPHNLQRAAPTSPPPQPQPEPQRRPQSRAERAETHQAFRDEMARTRRTDTERERRRRAARRRNRQEAEERARRAAAAAREAAEQPPQPEPDERPRHRPSAGKTAPSQRRSASRARNAPPKRGAAPSPTPISRICDLLSAQGWEDAVAAVRQRYREAGAAAPQSAEFVLSVDLDGEQRVAAVIVAAPGVLDGAALDYAIGRAEQVGAPFAFAANERMFRRAGVRNRARTNPKALSKFPAPDELREALERQTAEAEAADAAPKRKRGPANFGRLFRR